MLAGCAVGPDYQRPAPPPAAYKEAALPASEAGSWKTAEPSEEALRGEWWKLFGDEGLNQLQEEALRANQNLQAAAARLTQARALQREARAFFPSLDAAFGPSRQRPSAVSRGLPDGTPTSPSTTWRAQASVAYEADLFGRVSSTADAATADAQQSEALYRSVLLALQADVATTYFLVREQDAEAQLYRQTVQLRTETLQLIQRRHDAGDISELDAARAKSELAQAQSEALGIDRRRTAAEHALAVLLGRAPSDFAMPPQPLQKVAVSVPAGLPSALLERRPTSPPPSARWPRPMPASARPSRRSSRAWISPARSATSRRSWAICSSGPAARSCWVRWWARRCRCRFRRRPPPRGLDRARAVYEEDVALYRQTVLNAFREVEDTWRTCGFWRTRRGRRTPRWRRRRGRRSCRTRSTGRGDQLSGCDRSGSQRVAAAAGVGAVERGAGSVCRGVDSGVGWGWGILCLCLGLGRWLRSR